MKKIIVILVLFLVGCKAKHTTTTINKTDTIQTSKIVKVHPKTLNELVIENVCDSLGVLKLINYTNTTGKVKTTLKSDNNNLKLEVNIDSLKQEWVKEYESKNYTQKEIKVITKTIYPRWLWYSLGLNILLLLWVFRKPLFKIPF